jgi:predicted Fe-Mo cluster-binding NifX family protein
MKIAITSSGNTMDSTIDPRFGRCAYFAIYETGNNVVEFFPNPNKDAEEGAGPATVHLVSTFNVSKIVSGEFGQKIKSLLDELKIQMIVLKGPERKISDIIEMLNQ